MEFINIIMQSQITQNLTWKDNQPKRDGYRRSRLRSDDSCSTAESSMDINNEESGAASTCKNIDQIEFDWFTITNKLESQNSDFSDSPYLSKLNLPTIVEEEAEYDAWNTIKFLPNMFSKQNSEESPFWIIPKGKTSSFEDSCEHSELMNLLWKKIKCQEHY